MDDLLSNFQGCMLGHMLGDALGVPFEGMPAYAIWKDLGGAKKFLNELPVDRLVYSDDTEMMIGVAECLVDHGSIPMRKLMTDYFAKNFHENRGYGTNAHAILSAAAHGLEWESLASKIPGGSYGNGAAMRAAPLGLFFHDDLSKLDHETTQSAICTHTHQLGIEGAVIFAVAVAVAIKTRNQPFDRSNYFEAILPHSVTDEFKYQLKTAKTLTATDPIPFGSSLPAQRSVVSAICCFADSPNDFNQTVCNAITMGDDTDTLAGMAGALVGARMGVQCLPVRALNLVENDEKGCDYIRELATKLFHRFTRK